MTSARIRPSMVVSQGGSLALSGRDADQVKQALSCPATHCVICIGNRKRARIVELRHLSEQVIHGFDGDCNASVGGDSCSLSRDLLCEHEIGDEWTIVALQRVVQKVECQAHIPSRSRGPLTSTTISGLYNRFVQRDSSWRDYRARLVATAHVFGLVGADTWPDSLGQAWCDCAGNGAAASERRCMTHPLAIASSASCSGPLAKRRDLTAELAHVAVHCFDNGRGELASIFGCSSARLYSV